MGQELSDMTEGFRIGNVTIQGLFFADNIILISRTSEGLKHLLQRANVHCQRLKLELSVKKSKVLSPITL